MIWFENCFICLKCLQSIDFTIDSIFSILWTMHTHTQLQTRVRLMNEYQSRTDKSPPMKITILSTICQFSVFFSSHLTKLDLSFFDQFENVFFMYTYQIDEGHHSSTRFFLLLHRWESQNPPISFIQVRSIFMSYENERMFDKNVRNFFLLYYWWVKRC